MAGKLQGKLAGHDAAGVWHPGPTLLRGCHGVAGGLAAADCGQIAFTATVHEESGLEVTLPIYEYRCRACAHRFEALLKRMNEVAPECPKCGASQSDKLLSEFAVPRGRRKAPRGACGSTNCAGCRH